MKLDENDKTAIQNLENYSKRKYWLLMFFSIAGASTIFLFNLTEPLPGVILVLSGLLAGFSIERLYTISLTNRLKKLLAEAGLDSSKLP